MNNQVYSFSAKKEEDKAIIQKLKVEAIRTGRSFSWVVIQALKAYEANKKAETKVGV